MAPINPYFTGNLVRLRAIEPEDLDHFYRWENDTTLWSTGSNVAPVSLFALRTYIESTLSGNIYTMSDLRLIIERTSDGAVVGSADLYDIDHHNRRATVGLLIDPRHQRQGFGTAALEQLMRYAAEFLDIEHLHGYISVTNRESITLFTRAGFSCSGTLKRWIRLGKQFEDVHIFQYLADNEPDGV